MDRCVMSMRDGRETRSGGGNCFVPDHPCDERDGGGGKCLGDRRPARWGNVGMEECGKLNADRPEYSSKERVTRAKR